METIIGYLKEKYQPLAMIVYGSYADGTNGEGSDFDCLIVSQNASVHHDMETVYGVPLDVFIYAPEELCDEIDPFEFIQIDGGVIVMDTGSVAERLMQKVREYIENPPVKSRDELLTSIAWCEKMLKRARRGDAEGYFRWHWLLCDSLELYCDLNHRRYLGPKKSLRDMEKLDPEGYRIYSDALHKFTLKSLAQWITHMRKIADQRL